MRLRALVVDDEPLAREGLKQLLANDADVVEIREARNGHEALALIRESPPDLVFLDVQMPELDGFGVVRALEPGRAPAILFVTAHDEYAIQAFDFNAIDYLLKPVTEERFAVALERAKVRLQSSAPDDVQRQIASLLEAMVSPERYVRRFAIKAAGKVVFAEVDDIEWIEAAENYVELHLGGASHLMHVTLTALEKALDPGKFVRIHRSLIVQTARIAALEPALHGEYVVTLRSGARLNSSRTYADRLRALAANPF